MREWYRCLIADFENIGDEFYMILSVASLEARPQ